MPSGSTVPAVAGTSARSNARPETGGASTLRLFGPARNVRRAAAAQSPLLYFRSQTGHALSCVRALERQLGARRAGAGEILFSRAPVLFLKIEEAFFFYVLISLLRALTGRRTAGLLLKPMPLVASPRLHHRFKGGVLRYLRRFEAIHTLTILPFSVFPAVTVIAKGWIYGCQLWDLSEEERAAINVLRQERNPDDRLVLTTLGNQCRHKGFELFAATYANAVDLRARFQFISCGRVSPAVAAYASALRAAGGVAVDRFVSDAELLGAYAASDAVWCLYPPVGDHACGILGRAAQLGIPVVVRYGSLAHRLCIVENIQHISATAEGIADRLAGPLPPLDERRGHTMGLRFARESEATLRAVFGLAESPAEVPARQ